MRSGGRSPRNFLAPLPRMWATPVAQPANGSPAQFLERKRKSVAKTGKSMGIVLSDLNMQVQELEPESGSLNPTWVEWLMGFPLHWTEPMTTFKNTIRKRARKATAAVTACQECGATGPLERHHPDYATPEIVQVLCPPCHIKADQRDGTRTVKATKACAICGTEFLPTHSQKHTICSPKCRAEAGRRNAAKRWAGTKSQTSPE